MADGTGKVDAGSDLLRKNWFAEGLVQKAATSFWAPYKGTTMDSVIMVKNDIAAGKGTTVIFDFDGNFDSVLAFAECIIALREKYNQYQNEIVKENDKQDNILTFLNNSIASAYKNKTRKYNYN